VTQFQEKSKFLHQTITIDEPGVYDYEKVMHFWRGGGGCGYFENKPPVLWIRASGVEVKNFGFSDAFGGIVVEPYLSNVKLENVVGHTCSGGLEIRGGISGLYVTGLSIERVDGVLGE